ncbi:MAG: hypothetical protein NTV68_13825 [Methanomicrobiales archaeon]|nr:hypothetical protein [Methanomicrobiales archaeon]
MMEMRGMKKSAVYAVLVVIMCAALVATVSAATVDFGKNNQLFTQKGAVSQVPGTPGTMDTVKAVPNYLDFYTMIKPSAAIPYVYKPGSSGLPNFNAYRPSVPVYIPVITPVPQQGAGSSNSALGGLVILGANEGDTIWIRSHFYNSSKSIYNGRWQIAGYTPAYWEDQVLPGSYEIKLVNGGGNYGRNSNPAFSVYNGQVGAVYYCQTVTVVAGQTTTVDAGSAGMCPFGSCCG